MLVVAIVAYLLYGSMLWHTSADEMAFKYVAFGGDDEMDQVIEITNNGYGAVVPTLEITPLDETRQPIDGLTVSSAYGSDRGQRIVPAFFTELDVLRFEGERAGDVRDVRVRVKKLEQVEDYPEIVDVVDTDAYYRGKRSKEYDEPFDSVQLINPNEAEVKVQIVLIAWDEERGGDPQQALWSIRAGPPVKVGAKSRKMVPLPADLTDIAYVTIKTYLVR